MTGKKYAPLSGLLATATGRGATSVRITFADLAELVGGLPTSAYHRPGWWANGYLVQAMAWRSTGWRVSKVDLSQEWVLFTYVGPSVMPWAGGGQGSDCA
jgi:hypothetical protein